MLVSPDSFIRNQYEHMEINTLHTEACINDLLCKSTQKAADQATRTSVNYNNHLEPKTTELGAAVCRFCVMYIIFTFIRIIPYF